MLLVSCETLVQCILINISNGMFKFILYEIVYINFVTCKTYKFLLYLLTQLRKIRNKYTINPYFTVSCFGQTRTGILDFHSIETVPWIIRQLIRFVNMFGMTMNRAIIICVFLTATSGNAPIQVSWLFCCFTVFSTLIRSYYGGRSNSVL